MWLNGRWLIIINHNHWLCIIYIHNLEIPELIYDLVDKSYFLMQYIMTHCSDVWVILTMHFGLFHLEAVAYSGVASAYCFFDHPWVVVRNTYADIWGLRQRCSSCHPPNMWRSLEHRGQGDNHGYTDKSPGYQQCTGKRGSCRFPVMEVIHMRQLPHYKERSVAEGIL